MKLGFKIYNFLIGLFVLFLLFSCKKEGEKIPYRSARPLNANPSENLKLMNSLPYTQGDSIYRDLFYKLSQSDANTLLLKHLALYASFCKDKIQLKGINYLYKAAERLYNADYNQARNLSDSSLLYLTSPHLKKELIYATDINARIYSNIGAYDKSILQRYKLVDLLSTDTAEIKRKFYQVGNLGIDLYLSGNKTLAMEMMNAALHYFNAVKDTLYIALYESAKSVLLFSNKEYSTAIKHAEHSLILRLIKHDTIGAAESYNNLALSYMALKQWKTATDYLKLSLSFFRAMNSRRQIPVLLDNISNCYINENKPDSALPLLLSARNMAAANGQFDDIRIIYKDLCKIYERKKNWHEAYIYRKRLSVIKDSLFNIEKQEIIQEQIAKYDNLQKQQTIQTLQKDKVTEREKKKLYFLLLILSVTICLVVAVHVNFRNIKNRQFIISQKKTLELKVQHLQTEMKRNENDLEDFVNQLGSKSKQVAELQHEINTFHLKSNETKKLEDISGFRRLKIITENDWLGFKEHFDNVYPGFIPKIKTTYPTLSPAELRMFLLIRINIESDAVASMLGISAESAKKGRYRLKKKLGLDEQEDLTTFIRIKF